MHASRRRAIVIPEDVLVHEGAAELLHGDIAQRRAGVSPAPAPRMDVLLLRCLRHLASPLVSCIPDDAHSIKANCLQPLTVCRFHPTASALHPPTDSRPYLTGAGYQPPTANPQLSTKIRYRHRPLRQDADPRLRSILLHQRLQPLRDLPARLEQRHRAPAPRSGCASTGTPPPCAAPAPGSAPASGPAPAGCS